MRLLFYASPFNPLARNLFKDLQELSGIHANEYIGSRKSLVKVLRTPLGIATIGVLWPANGQELSRLVTLRGLLRDIRTVLILPDRQPETISDGHMLRPRFTAFADENPADVIAVAAKIIATLTRQEILPDLYPVFSS